MVGFLNHQEKKKGNWNIKNYFSRTEKKSDCIFSYQQIVKWPSFLNLTSSYQLVQLLKARIASSFNLRTLLVNCNSGFEAKLGNCLAILYSATIAISSFKIPIFFKISLNSWNITLQCYDTNVKYFRICKVCRRNQSHCFSRSKMFRIEQTTLQRKKLT